MQVLDVLLGYHTITEQFLSVSNNSYNTQAAVTADQDSIFERITFPLV